VWRNRAYNHSADRAFRTSVEVVRERVYKPSIDRLSLESFVSRRSGCYCNISVEVDRVREVQGLV
jgi:hypothetical protein